MQALFARQFNAWLSTFQEIAFLGAGPGTRGGREGQLPWAQWFTVEMRMPSFCYNADRSSDHVTAGRWFP